MWHEWGAKEYFHTHLHIKTYIHIYMQSVRTYAHGCDGETGRKETTCNN
jgi:hypothetical protein